MKHVKTQVQTRYVIRCKGTDLYYSGNLNRDPFGSLQKAKVFRALSGAKMICWDIVNHLSISTFKDPSMRPPTTKPILEIVSVELAVSDANVEYEYTYKP